VTALGAAVVFLASKPSARLLDSMLGFSAGVMLAASYWSLLAPSVAISEERGGIVWLPTALGFAVGGLGCGARQADAAPAHRGAWDHRTGGPANRLASIDAARAGITPTTSRGVGDRRRGRRGRRGGSASDGGRGGGVGSRARHTESARGCRGLDDACPRGGDAASRVQSGQLTGAVEPFAAVAGPPSSDSRPRFCPSRSRLRQERWSTS